MNTEKEQRQNKWIRSGDRVIAISGNERGRTGEVLRRVGGDRVIVQGFNVRKKCVKPSQANQKGGILELERPIHISNVMLCGEGDQPVKLKVRVNKDGERELFYRSGDKDVFYRSVKNPAK